MRYAHDHGRIRLCRIHFPNQLSAVLFLYALLRSPWVTDIHSATEILEFLHNIHHLRIAAIGAVFFEGNAQNKHVGVVNFVVLSDHQFDGLVGNELGNRIVDRSSGKNHFGVVSERFGFVRKVVGIYGNAMSAYESRTVFEEIPFRSGGINHVVGINPHAVADKRELVHKRDIHVSLCIFHRLGRLCHFHVGRTMGAV